MSSYPQHEENLKELESMGFEVSEYTEDPFKSWGYDELTYLVQDIIPQIRNKIKDSVPKWISVTDELPPLKKILDKPLSVSGEDIPPLNISINVLRIIQGDVSVGAVEWFDHGWVNATHWQPLPPPPPQQPTGKG